MYWRTFKLSTLWGKYKNSHGDGSQCATRPSDQEFIIQFNFNMKIFRNQFNSELFERFSKDT